MSKLCRPLFGILFMAMMSLAICSIVRFANNARYCSTVYSGFGGSGFGFGTGDATAFGCESVGLDAVFGACVLLADGCASDLEVIIALAALIPTVPAVTAAPALFPPLLALAAASPAFATAPVSRDPHPVINAVTDATTINNDLIFITISLCPCFVRGKERGRNLSRVSREALEKPCTIHERQCTLWGAFASSLARASNFPGFSWPTSARTLRFLAQIIPKSVGHCQDGNGARRNGLLGCGCNRVAHA